MNLFEGRVRRSPRVTVSSCSGITSLRSKPATQSSEELTIIATGASDASVSVDGSHSSKVLSILIHSIQPHVNDEDTVTVVETDPFVLLELTGDQYSNLPKL